MAYCSPDYRALFDNALNSSDDKQKFLDDWDDKHRSSMSQIVRAAHKIATKLDQKETEPA